VSYFPSEQARPVARERLASGLLGKIFGLLAFSLAFAAAGGAVGSQIGPGWIMPLFFVEIGLIFAVQRLREREGINLVLLYAFATVSGITIGPIIAAYVGAGLGTVVLEAAGITGAMTIGLSAYALTTKRDLSGLQPYLFMALLGLIVASLVNIFVGGTVMYTILSWGGAMLFSVLLIFDVNRARYATDTMGNAVVLTLGIYLDIVNLFLFVLRILQGGGRR
jgi:uncharacterized protein